MLHFVALAYITVLIIKDDAKFLSWKICRPLILCGHHSLHIFCVGIVLSFFAHVVLVEIHSALSMQTIVSIIGISIMMIVAYFLEWYKVVDDAVDAPNSSSLPSSSTNQQAGKT